MKKIITSLLFIIIAITIVSAQGKNDPEAKKILTTVTSKFKTFKSVQAKFNVKIENAAGKIIGTKLGTVYMKGLKYKVAISGQEIYCDGATVSTFDPSSKELTITKVDVSGNAITPQKIFANDSYDKDFLYKMNPNKTVTGKIVQEIELTPTDKTKSFFKVLVDIDKTKQTIVSTKIFQKTGERYTYTISNMNTKIPLDDALFVFDKSKYPGTEVVDLR